MGIAKTVFGLAILIIGAAWDGFVVGGVYATNAFSPPPGSAFDYNLFGLYIAIGVFLAAVGILLIAFRSGGKESHSSEVT